MNKPETGISLLTLRPLRRILEIIGSRNNVSADTIISQVAPEWFMLREGDAVTINIGDMCTDACKPIYRIVKSSPYFSYSEKTILIKLQDPNYDKQPEEIVIARQVSSGTWQKSMISLRQVGIVNQDPDYLY